MAENIPQLPFANERQTTPQPNQNFTAEDIRSRMNAINGYLNTNRPAVLAGITQGQADQAAVIGQYKDYMGQGTSEVPRVQNLISGNTMTGPNPGLKGLDVPTIDYVNTLMNKSKIDLSTKADPYFFARPTSFNASKYGLNYDRYYSHPKFKELGFSIYRDNESEYNAKSSWTDDFRRMGSKWFGLAWQGGSGMFKNWGQFGAFGEAQDAAQMENDLSVAMSSKSGAGAWTTNFLANSAYTVGIIGEIAAEEAVLWGATALTGGATSPLAVLKTGQNLSRLGASMKIMAQTLNKADKAKSFWGAAKGAGTSVGKFLNPLGGTTDIVKDALNANSAFNRLNDFAKTTKTFGAFYRDMREINAVTAESRLEGGFVQNKVANDSLAAFIKENNRMPTVEEANVISDNAFKAGQATAIANAPAIYLSNKVVLNTALKGFKPIRRLMNQEALSSSLFKTVSNYGWKAAGKKPMEVVQKGLLNSAKRTFSKDYLKSIPSRMKGTFSAKGAGVAIGGGLRYFSANLMEGLQESYQEAIQSGMNDYYMNNYFADLYKDPHLAAKNSMAASIMKGFGEQASMQGLDVFAQGFLMGGVLGGAQNLVMPGLQRGTMKATDYFKKTNTYEEYVKTEKERLQKYADAVNSYTENPSLYAHWLDENTVLQRDLADNYQRAEETGDRVEAENSKDDSLFAHVSTLLQAGKFDGFIDQLEGMREMSDDDLKDAFGTYDEKTDQNKKSPRQRLETAIEKANNVKERYDSINEKFKNPYNPDLFDRVKDKEAYDAEHTGYVAYEIAKRSIAFNEYTFGRTLERLDSLVNNAATNGPLGNVAASDFSALYTSDMAYMRHVQTLNAEIEALNLGSAQDKALAKKKSTQLENLQELRDSMKQYKTLLLLIEKAKLQEGDTEDGKPVDIEDLKEIKALVKEAAKAFALKMNIVGEGAVDEETDQISMDFEQEGIEHDVVINEYMKDALYRAYAKYTKNIADLNNVFPIQTGIENSFGDLIDYMKLDAQAKHMSEYADMIANPMAIYNMAARVKNALETTNSRRKELHLEALQNYKDNILDVNDLLEKLFGIGVYFDPDAIKAFRKDGKLPNVFFSAADGSVIDKDNPKYKEIVDLINEEEVLRGKTFSNKPVPPPAPPAPSAPPAAGTSVVQPPPPEDELEETVVTTFDVNTEFASLPKEMQDKLKAAHADAILSGATNDIQEWMKESPVAAQIIAGVEPVKQGEPKKPTTPPPASGAVITAANPKSIAGPTPDLQPIYDALANAGWKLSEDQKTYVSKDGKQALRVSDLKEGKPEMTAAMKAAAGRGNIVDVLLREFANPVVGAEKLSIKDVIINNRAQGISDNTSKLLIENFIRAQFTVNKLAEKNGFTADEGFIKDMTNVLFDLALRFKNYTWHTNLPTMVGNLVGKTYGGTIDLLLEKNGKYYIIDLKTSAVARKTKEKLYDKNDQIQQNAYAELFEQLTGKSVSAIRILNLLTKTNSDNTVLQSVELYHHKDENDEPTVLDKLDRISVAELKGYKPETPEETPPITPAPEAPTTPTSDKEADIERRRQEELKNIPVGSAAMVRYVVDGNNADLTEEETNTAEEIIQAFIQNGEKNVEKVVSYLQRQGFVRAVYVSMAGQAAYIKARLEGTITTPVNGNLVNDINAKYNAEQVERLRAEEQAELAKAIPNMAEYPDTYGKKQGNMPDALYAIYKPIYDKYDKLITPLLPSAPATDAKARIKSKAITKLDQSEKELVKAKKELEEINSNPRAGKDDVPRLEYYIKSLEDIIINARLISQAVDFYIGRWETPNSNGEGVVIDGKTISIPEFTSLYNVASKNLLENYNAELAASGKPTTPEVDWNAVIDRATSAQEVDKIMDQIYAANASSPELIDRALVKKQSFKPAKTKVPSRFIGKVIWAQLGTVNPEIFEKYDVVNSDTIVEEIAKKRGITAAEGKTIHQTIQNLSKEVRADIQNQVKAEIEKLKGEGKTIITSNYYMKGSPLVDITSMPASKEAVFMSEGTSPEDSIRRFEKYMKENQYRDSEFTESQQKDWSSQQLSNGALIEKNTNSTVQQLFERGTVRSTPARSITNAGNSEYLKNSIAAYISNPEIRNEFTVTDSNGVERILAPEEVIEMAKKRAGKLMQDEELDTFNQEIDNMMAMEMGTTQPTVNQEDKASAQDAINSAASTSDTAAATASDIASAAASKTEKEVDDEFDDSLDCK